MKKISILMFFVFAAVTALLARTRGEYTVKAGQSVLSVIPVEERYQFPQFDTGRLIFDNKKISGILKLNYNMLAQCAAWIDPKGDTMAFSNDAKIATEFHGGLVDSFDYFTYPI